jgi:hypothetical protein
LFDLEQEYPILIFPIRIETKYAIKKVRNEQRKILRVRFFPDQILINNFDRRLTQKEIEDAKNYWNKLREYANTPKFKKIRDSEWQKLAQKYDCARAGYISKAVINYNPNLDPDPTKPQRTTRRIEVREEGENIHRPSVCDILPSKFVLYAKFKDAALATLRIVSKQIPETLYLSPFYSEGLSGIRDLDTVKWIADFQAAKRVGMALEINLSRLGLTEKQYREGFEYIIAYGVRDYIIREDEDDNDVKHIVVTPQETKEKIEMLFQSHRYDQGFSLLKQGTPTNLSKDQFTEYSSFSRTDPKLCRKIEFPSSKLDQNTDGYIFEKALGVESTTYGINNSNNRDQLDSKHMSTALWPVTIGYFLQSFIEYEPIREPLRKHFIKYVKAQGSIPPFRIGRVPYGILPTTLLSEWKDSSILPNTDYIIRFFLQLKKRWQITTKKRDDSFIDEVPTVMGNGPGDSPTQKLLNVLSMEAISHSYYVRGIRSADYIASILRPPMSNEERQYFNKRYKGLINTEILGRTFNSGGGIPEDIIPGLYTLVPGKGITGIKDPLVKFIGYWGTYGNYIEIMYKYLRGWYWETTDFQEHGTRPEGCPAYEQDTVLFKLLRYSASLLGKDKSNSGHRLRDEFAHSLLYLAKYLARQTSTYDPIKLEYLMLQTLDLASYRLDEWLSSFANQRLEEVRTKENKAKGLYAGAFGWIENLAPKLSEQDSGSETKKAITDGGYIQAPSYIHAATAAVLRNGYLTHSDDSDKKDLLKINLNSERTKNSLEILQGIQNMPLGELLGYRLERRLHDAEVDYLIDEFRRHFPINKDDLSEIEDSITIIEPAKERVQPRNLVDGYLVYKNWKRLVDTVKKIDPSIPEYQIRNFMSNDSAKGGWKGFLEEIIAKYAMTDAQTMDENKLLQLLAIIKYHLNYILDLIDGLSDLCISEAVYQALNGKMERSAAVLDGLSGEGQKIPVPEIANITRTGARQIQRIVFAIQSEALDALNLLETGEKPWTNPRKAAEPNLNQILESYYGDIIFWIDLKDIEGNTVFVDKEVKLSDLELEPMDLLYIEEAELKARLMYFGKAIAFDCNIDNYNLKPAKYENDITKKSLSEMQFLIRSLQEIGGKGQQPLKYTDFLPLPNGSGNNIDDSCKQEISKGIKREVFQRFYDVLLLLDQTIDELKKAKENTNNEGDNTDRDRIEMKKKALVHASLFGIPSAIPLGQEGNILVSVEQLDDRIEFAINELANFQLNSNLIERTSTKWRARLKKEGGEDGLFKYISKRIGSSNFSIDDDLKTFLEVFLLGINSMLNMLNDQAFLVLPPFIHPDGVLNSLKSSKDINKKALKWVQKAAYVRPRLKLFDDVITFNQIFESSSSFSFYYDESKFNQSSEDLLENNKDPLCLVVISSKKFPPPSSKKIAGIVVDEWVDKIISKQEDTVTAFQYDGPNTEAPQSLLLAVPPRYDHKWNEKSIRKVILETLELVKIRAVDYRSIKELRALLPTIVPNSVGEDVRIKFYTPP